MIEKTKRYHESLIQWVWEQLEFDCKNLQTTCGRNIQIISPGKLNHGKGPDFSNASIIIDGIQWHGSVEIHNHANEWNIHGHQNDASFNNVILHVVLENPHKKVLTLNGHTPFILYLKPYLHSELNRLLYLKQNRKLPCGGQVTFIHQKAFEKQIEEAHREYFSFKVDEFTKSFDPHELPSIAWKKSLIYQLYKVLGIPSNKEPMQKLAGMMMDVEQSSFSLREFVEKTEQIAFQSKEEIGWVKSGMRPASHPSVRVKQVAVLHYTINKFPMKTFLKEGISAWEKLNENLPSALKVGGSRKTILKNTVVLPGFFMLGDLFHVKKIKKEAIQTWQEALGSVPQEVKNPFIDAGFELKPELRKLGLAHQYKRYCLEKQCHRCEVFKSAIRS